MPNLLATSGNSAPGRGAFQPTELGLSHDAFAATLPALLVGVRKNRDTQCWWTLPPPNPLAAKRVPSSPYVRCAVHHRISEPPRPARLHDPVRRHAPACSALAQWIGNSPTCPLAYKTYPCPDALLHFQNRKPSIGCSLRPAGSSPAALLFSSSSRLQGGPTSLNVTLLARGLITHQERFVAAADQSARECYGGVYGGQQRFKLKEQQ
jgi:hypothetical protein